MRLPWVLAALALSALAADDGQNVVLASRRGGRVEIFDAATLRPLGTIGVDVLAESVEASPDGRTLFVAQQMRSQPNSCCALFSLNLENREMCFVREPTMKVVPSPDGQKLYFQRGNAGIEVLDGRTLARLPVIKAPGVYSLKPSPDGRWLMGTSNWPSPSLDIFDLPANAMVRRIALPVQSPAGVWSGNQFLLYGSDGKQGSLWALTSGSTELGTAVHVNLPGLEGKCESAVHNLAAAGGHLFLYDLFGGKVDPRDACRSVPGGVFEVDAAGGAVISHLAPRMFFGRVSVSADGESVYGLDISTVWTGVRLVRVDRRSGEVVAEQRLEDDVWNLAVARIPSALLPRGYMLPAACSKSMP